MSTNSGLAGKTDKAKDGKKYAHLNISKTYKGKSFDPQKPNVTRHGLQTLGKVVTTARRMPMPANLPSIRSENSGNDPSVNLVPGGSGWGTKKPPSGSSPSGEPAPAAPSDAVPTSSQAGPQRGASAAPSSSSVASTSGPGQGASATTGSRLWSSVTQGSAAAADREIVQDSRLFQKDFPTLGDKGKNGQEKEPAEPSLRPQGVGSWREGGGRNVQQYEPEDRNGPPPTGSPASHYPDRITPSPVNLGRDKAGGPMGGLDLPRSSNLSTEYQAESRNGPPVKKTNAPSQPIVVNKKKLEELIDVNDNGEGWASASGEVDYNAKLVFDDDDEEEDEPTLPPPAPLKKQPSTTVSQKPNVPSGRDHPSSAPRSSGYTQHRSDERGPPSSRDAWYHQGQHPSHQSQRPSHQPQHTSHHQGKAPDMYGPGRLYEGSGQGPPHSSRVGGDGGRPGPPSFPAGNISPRYGMGSSYRGNRKHSDEFVGEEDAHRREAQHQKDLAIERGRQKRERASGSRLPEDDQDPAPPPPSREGDDARGLGRQDSSGNSTHQHGGPPRHQMPGPHGGRMPAYDGRYGPMPMPPWIAAVPMPPSMNPGRNRAGSHGSDEGDKKGRQEQFEMTPEMQEYQQHVSQMFIHFLNSSMGPRGQMGGPVHMPFVQPPPAGMYMPPDRDGNSEHRRAPHTPESANSEGSQSNKFRYTEKSEGGGNTRSKQSSDNPRKRPLEPKTSGKKGAELPAARDDSSKTSDKESAPSRKESGRVPIPVNRDAQRGMSEVKSNLVTLTKGSSGQSKSTTSHTSTGPKDHTESKANSATGNLPKKNAWQMKDVGNSSGEKDKGQLKSQQEKADLAESDYKEKSDRKGREKSEDKPPVKKSREDRNAGGQTGGRSNHLQQRGSRGRGTRDHPSRGTRQPLDRGAPGGNYRGGPNEPDRSSNLNSTGGYSSRSEFRSDRKSNKTAFEKRPAGVPSGKSDANVDSTTDTLATLSLSTTAEAPPNTLTRLGDSSQPPAVKFTSTGLPTSKPAPAPMPSENIWEKRKQEKQAEMSKRQAEYPPLEPREYPMSRFTSQDCRPEAHSLKIKDDDNEKKPSTKHDDKETGKQHPTYQSSTGDHRTYEDRQSKSGGHRDYRSERADSRDQRRGNQRGRRNSQDYVDRRDYREDGGYRKSGTYQETRDRRGPGKGRREDNRGESHEGGERGSRDYRENQEYTGDNRNRDNRDGYSGNMRSRGGRARSSRGSRGAVDGSSRSMHHDRSGAQGESSSRNEDGNRPAHQNYTGTWEERPYSGRSTRGRGARGRGRGGRGGRAPHALAVSPHKPHRTRTESGTDGNVGDDKDEWETASESTPGASTIDQMGADNDKEEVAPPQKKPSSRPERRPESKKYSASERHRGDRNSQSKTSAGDKTSKGKSSTGKSGTMTTMHVNDSSNSKAMQTALADVSNKKSSELSDVSKSLKSDKESRKPNTDLSNYDVNNYAGVVIVDDRFVEDADPGEWEDDEDGFQEVVSKKAQQKKLKAQAQMEEENSRKMKLREKEASSTKSSARVRQHSGTHEHQDSKSVRYPQLPPRLQKQQKEKNKQKREKQFKIDRWDNDLSKSVASTTTTTSSKAVQPPKPGPVGSKAIPALMSQSTNPTEDLLSMLGGGTKDSTLSKVAAASVGTVGHMPVKKDQEQHDSGVDINESKESAQVGAPPVASMKHYKPLASDNELPSEKGLSLSKDTAPTTNPSANAQEDNVVQDSMQHSSAFSKPSDMKMRTFEFQPQLSSPLSKSKGKDGMEASTEVPASPEAADLNQKIDSCKTLWDSEPIPGIPTPSSFSVSASSAGPSFGQESLLSPSETTTNVCKVKPLSSSEPAVSVSGLGPQSQSGASSLLMPSSLPSQVPQPLQQQQSAHQPSPAVAYPSFLPPHSNTNVSSESQSLAPTLQFPTFTPSLMGQLSAPGAPANILVQNLNNPLPGGPMNPVGEASFPVSSLYGPPFSATGNPAESGMIVSTSSVMSTSIKPSSYGGSFQTTAAKSGPFDQVTNLGQQPSMNQPQLYVQYDRGSSDLIHPHQSAQVMANQAAPGGHVAQAASSMFPVQYPLQSRQPINSSLYSQQQAPHRTHFFAQGAGGLQQGGGSGAGFPAVLAPTAPVHLGMAMPSSGPPSGMPMGNTAHLVGQANNWKGKPQQQQQTPMNFKQQQQQHGFQPVSQGQQNSFLGSFDQGPKWSTEQDKIRKPFQTRVGPPRPASSGHPGRQQGMVGPEGPGGAMGPHQDSAMRPKQPQQQKMPLPHRQGPHSYQHRPQLNQPMRHPNPIQPPIQRPHQKKHMGRPPPSGQFPASEHAKQREDVLKVARMFLHSTDQANLQPSTTVDNSQAFFSTSATSLSAATASRSEEKQPTKPTVVPSAPPESEGDNRVSDQTPGE